MSEGLIQQSNGDGTITTPSLSHVLARVNLVQEVMKSVMKENTHYGPSFVGDKKKNLLKPGADALGMAFMFSPEFEISERDLGGDHREYRVTCTLKTQSTGILIATGVGTCSTKESKYRYRNSSLKCPKCGNETVIKGKEDFGGGWLCWRQKGGCGATWKDGDAVIEKQPRGKVENTDPADVWNTALKIGKKRAMVDAMITATGASDMFTQDAEDIADNLQAQKEKDEHAAPKPEPAKPAQAPAPQNKPTVPQTSRPVTAPPRKANPGSCSGCDGVGYTKMPNNPEVEFRCETCGGSGVEFATGKPATPPAKPPTQAQEPAKPALTPTPPSTPAKSSKDLLAEFQEVLDMYLEDPTAIEDQITKAWETMKIKCSTNPDKGLVGKAFNAKQQAIAAMRKRGQ